MSHIAAATMPDLTGCAVNGRFRLVRMLGSGTYGVVYQAVDTHVTPSDNTPSLAIKMIRKAGRMKHELAAARREIALHGLVSDHPSVVTVRDAYEDDDYFYLIMDFCRTGDLFEPICRKVYVNNDALVRKAFVSLVDAVEACHSLRIYHRDLKPENILVSEDRSQVYLADFGLATNQPIVQEFYCGTAAYMSPECIGHLSGFRPYYTALSDIWSLGVILVNMISGRNPWEKATLDDPCFIQFIENPDFLFDMLPISEGANDILRHIFVLNPLGRPSLQDLRMAILELDTFWRYDDELSVVEEYIRAPAPTLGEADLATGRLTRASYLLASMTSFKPSYETSSRDLSSVASRPQWAFDLPPLTGEGCSGDSESTVGSTTSLVSSPESSMVLTPENTTTRVELEEKDVAGRVVDPDATASSITDLLFPILNAQFRRST
ncbi:kinase-like protein [Dichomitus squalens]|uniref:Kinase-like protein n=1 Tax=Dichomitus squalens TaxID=114155 RepID=A0A4Q9NIX0_9APHY|nr:kinase-like protein [Dichomitus squalens]TBU58055.1 kinase-like protein [Dichomitus squalens]